MTAWEDGIVSGLQNDDVPIGKNEGPGSLQKQLSTSIETIRIKYEDLDTASDVSKMDSMPLDDGGDEASAVVEGRPCGLQPSNSR